MNTANSDISNSRLREEIVKIIDEKRSRYLVTEAFLALIKEEVERAEKKFVEEYYLLRIKELSEEVEK